MTQLRTAECVTQGHPDKIADQIADAIVDASLASDPMSRVACEVLVSREFVVLAGKITTQAKIDYTSIAKQVIQEIGYNDPSLGLCHETCQIVQSIQESTPESGKGNNPSQDADQLMPQDPGILIGFATDETYQAMPMAYELARNITRNMRLARVEGKLPYLRPDGQAQVSLRYNEEGDPIHIESIALSCQHDETIDLETLRQELCQLIIQDLDPALITRRTRFFINPTKRFLLGGAAGAIGLTGRKIIADTYGAFVCHGGGTFSGKDPTRIERSAAYACRYLAKNIVKAGLARQAQVQVAYAIGKEEPIELSIDLIPRPDGICIDSEKLAHVCLNLLDMKPSTLIERFQLRRPIYRQIAYDGHFGREDLELPWENLDLIEPLQSAFGLDAFYDTTPF